MFSTILLLIGGFLLMAGFVCWVLLEIFGIFDNESDDEEDIF